MLTSERVRFKLFYGWIVVASLFIIGATLMGIRLTYGVFFKSIEEEFYLSRSATSLIFSTYLAISCVFVTIGGWASDRYGPRITVFLMGLFTGLSLLLTSQVSTIWELFITYGLLLAIGTAAKYVVTMSIVSRWFDKKRGLALGITSSGDGLGTLIMAPFATFLISNLDWQKAYLIIGLITLIIVLPTSRLLKRNPREIGVLPDGLKSASRIKPGIEEDIVHLTSLSLTQTFRTKNFWLILFIWLFYGCSLYLIFTHIVPHAMDIGMPPLEAATILSVIGASSVFGRVIWGIASDKVGRKISLIICSAFQSITLLWLIGLQELWEFYAFALIYGFAYAGMAPCVGAIISDSFGLSKIGAIFGILEIGFALGAAVGPVLGGLIFDLYNNYDIAFIVGSSSMLLVTLLVAITNNQADKIDELDKSYVSP